MKNRPKIMVLSPSAPYPVLGGGHMRMASIIPALSEFGTVHVVCTTERLEESAGVWAKGLGITVEALAARPLGWLRLIVERLTAVLTLSNLRFRADEKRKFDEAFHRFGPDLVWLETPYLLRYALDWGRSVSVVVDYWGTSEGAERIYRLSRGVQRVPSWVRWQCARGGERRYAPRLSAIVCVSELDAARFKRIASGCPVYAISMAVPGGRHKRRAPHAQASPARMIFTGDMSYRPNVDAAVFFSKEIFPAIRAAVPEARIVFVGRNPHPEVAALAQAAGVEVAGAVRDLTEEIAKADLYVLPMRLGSGVRTKLFEVFPMGVPIVTTPIGAEGLALRHDENCLVAEPAAEFARACIRLLGSPQERQRLGRNASRLTVETYSQDAVCDQMRSLLDDLLCVPGQGSNRPLRRLKHHCSAYVEKPLAPHS